MLHFSTALSWLMRLHSDVHESLLGSFCSRVTDRTEYEKTDVNVHEVKHKCTEPLVSRSHQYFVLLSR